MNKDDKYKALRFATSCFEDARRDVVRIKLRIDAAGKNEWTDPALEQALKAAEQFRDSQERMMVRVYRNVAPPAIRAFQQSTIGLGEPGMARLVSVFGDFRTYTRAWWVDGDNEDKRQLMTEDTPRSLGVRDAYAYAGMGDPDRKRRKGEDGTTAGSPRAKDAAWQVANAIINHRRSPYREHYDKTRARYAITHEDWTDNHSHLNALKLVAKAVLKDIWRVQHDQLPAFGAPTPWTPRS